MEAVSSTWR